MIKVCAIGDPHGNFQKISKVPKNVDMYLITGDVGKADLARKRAFDNIKRKKEGLAEEEMSPSQSKKIHDEIHYSTLDIFKKLSRYAPVYSIQGNVGISTLSESKKYEKKYGLKHAPTMEVLNKLEKVNLVKNRLRIINGLRVGFLEYFVDTCWVREFKPSDYKRAMKKAKKESDRAKRVLNSFYDLDILVCHQPPYGILDKVNFPGVPEGWKGKHAGSKVILDYVKKFQPKYVFCGHIHEGEGKKKIGRTEVYNLGVASNMVVDL